MKTFWGLLASVIALLLSVAFMTPVDIWHLSPFRPYARTSRVRRWMFNGPPQRLQIHHRN